MKRLSYWIIVGQSRLKPKLKWKKRVKAVGKPNYRWLFISGRVWTARKGKVAVWKWILSQKRRTKGRISRTKRISHVYSSVAAMAIAELIEAKESDLIPYKSASNMIFVGREQRDLNDFSWISRKIPPTVKKAWSLSISPWWGRQKK